MARAPSSRSLIASRDPRRGITLNRQQWAEASVIATLNELMPDQPGVAASHEAAVRLIEGCTHVSSLFSAPPPPPSAPALSPAPAPAEYTQDVWQLILGGLSLRELSGCAKVCRVWRDAAHGAVSGWEEVDIHAVCGGGMDTREILSDQRRLRSLAEWVGGASAVQALRLSASDISDMELRTLVHPPLALQGPPGAREMLAPALRRLDLSFCARLSDLCVPTLAAIPLTSLNLDGVHRITNRGLLRLCSSLGASLRELHIDGESLDDHTLHSLMAGLGGGGGGRLEAFGISFCEQLSDRALGALRPCMLGLRCLTLRKGRFSDAAMAKLLRTSRTSMSDSTGTVAARGLRRLDLSEGHLLSRLTGEAIGAIGTCLEELTLSWCWAMKDDAIAPIVQPGHCPALRKLLLVGLKELTSSTLLPLGAARACPELELLDVSQCDYCEDAALQKIAMQLSACTGAGAGGQPLPPLFAVRNYYGEVLRVVPTTSGQMGGSGSDGVCCGGAVTNAGQLRAYPAAVMRSSSSSGS